MLSEMDAKTQAIEERAGAQYAVVTRRIARDIGERVGWVGDRACLDRAKAAPCSSPSAIKCGQTLSTMPP
jgi:hypothetical protein